MNQFSKKSQLIIFVGLGLCGLGVALKLFEGFFGAQNVFALTVFSIAAPLAGMFLVGYALGIEKGKKKK